MQLKFSFIIPVFNRPDEVAELLQSFTTLAGNFDFEIVIIEDGSTNTCKAIVNSYTSTLNIAYYFKENSGPGDSRNFGMKKAKGNYFIILDSDCILPENYLQEVNKSLNNNYTHCFGGPDTAHNTFTRLQKAINFAMTSFISTGGIRGSKHAVNKFQPRSFNMGLSKKAFLASNGFGNIHPGEDPDLTIRLWKLGYNTQLIPEAKVYHKRRISWGKFYQQVKKFGMVRPILNRWHPSTKKVTYWLPSLFSIGFLLAIVLLFFKVFWLLNCYIFYALVTFVIASIQTKSMLIGLQSVFAVFIQFFGYGIGFLKTTFGIIVLKKNPEKDYPKLFF